MLERNNVQLRWMGVLSALLVGACVGSNDSTRPEDAGTQSTGVGGQTAGGTGVTGGTKAVGGTNASGGTQTTTTTASVGGTAAMGGSATTAATSTTNTGGNASVGGSTSATSASGGSTSTGGVANVGGTSALGGATSTSTALSVGGIAGAGGVTSPGSTASTAGGTAATGGAAMTGGTASAGGANAAGGTTAIGGATVTGGASAIGGTTATGGESALGGATGTGGTPASGGDTATGGAVATGGESATGGSAATGGAATGGEPATGGSVATGGAATGGDATGGMPDTGGTAATGGASSVSCPGTGGPTMVRLPEGYCIDTTEVTQAQYNAWLAKRTDLPSASDANCGWNASNGYAPDAVCTQDNLYYYGKVCQGAGCENQPQVCVDWCDAAAYCQGVGKRLCGKIGGGPNDYSAYDDATQSQWQNACSSHGSYTYAYGTSYSSTTCNGSDYQTSIGANYKTYTTVAAGSLTACQSSVAGRGGIFDLTGNVWEWEDSCNGTGSTAQCHIRGGSFQETTSQLACKNIDMTYTASYVANSHRNGVSINVGFRCCAD